MINLNIINKPAIYIWENINSNLIRMVEFANRLKVKLILIPDSLKKAVCLKSIKKLEEYMSAVQPSVLRTDGVLVLYSAKKKT